MNHKFSGAFIWEKMFKKKKKAKKVSSVKSLVLNKATCSFSLSVPVPLPIPLAQLTHDFVFVDPSYTHMHTWDRIRNTS